MNEISVHVSFNKNEDNTNNFYKLFNNSENRNNLRKIIEIFSIISNILLNLRKIIEKISEYTKVVCKIKEFFWIYRIL